MFNSYSVFKDQAAVLCRSTPVICLCDFAAVIRAVIREVNTHVDFMGVPVLKCNLPCIS